MEERSKIEREKTKKADKLMKAKFEMTEPSHDSKLKRKVAENQEKISAYNKKRAAATYIGSNFGNNVSKIYH